MSIKHNSLNDLFMDIANVMKHNTGTINDNIVADDFPIKIINMQSNGCDVRIKKLIERTMSTITPYSLEGITSIGIDAFSGCTNLALTSLPEGITSIGTDAFSGCTNLALTSLPEGIKSIGTYAFFGCTNLALTSLPEGLIRIDNGTFQDCKNLALTSLPEGITSIGDHAFYNCTNLKSLTFKGTPTTIDSKAFNACYNLITINVPWSEGEVANAPWGASKATINYNYTGE